MHALDLLVALEWLDHLRVPTQVAPCLQPDFPDLAQCPQAHEQCPRARDQCLLDLDVPTHVPCHLALQADQYLVL